MTFSEKARVWRLRARGFAVAGALCLALILLLKSLAPTEFATSVIGPLVLVLVLLWLYGFIAPTALGKILEKMKCDAADQRKQLAKNGMSCIRPQARCSSAARGQNAKSQPEPNLVRHASLSGPQRGVRRVR
jgi:hypothetical protein